MSRCFVNAGDKPFQFTLTIIINHPVSLVLNHVRRLAMKADFLERTS